MELSELFFNPDIFSSIYYYITNDLNVCKSISKMITLYKGGYCNISWSEKLCKMCNVDMCLVSNARSCAILLHKYYDYGCYYFDPEDSNLPGYVDLLVLCTKNDKVVIYEDTNDDKPANVEKFICIHDRVDLLEDLYRKEIIVLDKEFIKLAFGYLGVEVIRFIIKNKIFVLTRDDKNRILSKSGDITILYNDITPDLELRIISIIKLLVSIQIDTNTIIDFYCIGKDNDNLISIYNGRVTREFIMNCLEAFSRHIKFHTETLLETAKHIIDKMVEVDTITSLVNPIFENLFLEILNHTNQDITSHYMICCMFFRSPYIQAYCNHPKVNRFENMKSKILEFLETIMHNNLFGYSDNYKEIDRIFRYTCITPQMSGFSVSADGKVTYNNNSPSFKIIGLIKKYYNKV